ncbi:MAG: glycosyltransferase, exosortase A system-associated [Kiloniellales bacterium]|nr:glycosyltransferase, exosortase A system-associated [Kiloniellales bacterium]
MPTVEMPRDRSAEARFAGLEGQKAQAPALAVTRTPQMRILHVFDHSIPLHSGYTFRSRAILQHQRLRGWDTHHLTTPKHYAPSPPCEDVDGLRFYRTPRQSGLVTKLPVVAELDLVRKTAKRLLEVAREIRPDVIHAHSPVLNPLAAHRVARRLGLPLIYEIRAFWEDAAAAHGTCREWGPRYRATRWLEDRAIRSADAVTTICEGLRRDVIARGHPAEKVTVIPNAVDLQRFSQAAQKDEALAQSLGLAGTTVLGFIGSFYDYEGLEVAIEAMPPLLAERPDIRLILVGGGPEDENLRRRAARLGVEDKVLFTGRVPHEQVERYYGLVDIFVYPRKSMRLTELVTPLKPLEAMAQHKMVLASDVGGHRELIREGVTGSLFKADDPGALAAAVKQLLAERESWPERLAQARRFVEEERSWAASVANYAPLLERLTHKPA